MSIPVINVGNGNLPSLSNEAWAALKRANNPEYLFQRGGVLVRIEVDDTGAPTLRVLTADKLRHELARCAKWIRHDKYGNESETLPPMYLVKDLLAYATLPLPVLVRLTRIPVFASDGSLVLEPGYHAAAKIYYHPPASLRFLDVAPCPSAQDLEFAQFLILDLLKGFPFVGASDLAHAVALFLLPFARELINGPTPNHLIESPTPGTGKGLLADVLLRTAIGPNISGFSQAHTGEEWRKRLTASFLKGDDVILIDNLTEALDSGELASALTTIYWEDRLLGRNETVKTPVRCVWVTTANNPVMSTEISRRSIRIRLDPRVDRPWLRTKFPQKNLKEFADDARALLVRAAHTMIRAWLSAGKPAPKTTRLGSYEIWSDVIGGILEVAGIPGFLGNILDFYEAADTDGALWREFTEKWWSQFQQLAVGVAELLPLALKIDGFELSGIDDHAKRISFGRLLSKQRDRVFGNVQIVMAGTAQRATKWRLVQIETNNYGSE
jgi:putative DNA primase/helicase